MSDPIANADASHMTDLPAREPRSADEVRELIDAAADFHASVADTGHDFARVSERDGVVSGSIAVTRTTDRDFTAANQLVNAAGGDVTGEARTRAGKQGVHFRFEVDGDDDDDEITVDDLEGAIDAEIRNPAKGMTLGFISNVDPGRGDVLTRGPGDDEPVRRPVDEVLRLLNGGGSWEIHDGAPLSNL